LKSVSAALLVLALLPIALPAQKKPKKPEVPEVFAHARYIYVEAIEGNQFNPRLLRADRKAIADVEAALQDWGRYQLTTRREDADLVFIIRTGRLAEANLGGRIGGGAQNDPQDPSSPNPQSGQSPGRNPRAGGQLESGLDVGPPDDLLQICQLNTDGKLSSPIWRRTQQDGLLAPQIPLLQQLRIAVTRSYPPAPPTHP